MNSTSLETSQQSVVTALQANHGITLLHGVLADRAGLSTWERQHSRRSGRVARQFIDDLEAGLKRDTV